ncbi:MAG TPA: carboxypeptidase-like regulatory domain-containing protein, partial [Ginsengibacter sp.]|nr:carboxypeptidase-like regulatory domain-containing protein [Ginsengibacter sp.]
MGKFLTLMTVFMLSGLLAFSQNRTVSGTVTDNTGTALPGVSVQVPGTQIGGVTNAQGAFSLNLPASAKELSFSNVGFLTQV